MRLTDEQVVMIAALGRRLPDAVLAERVGLMPEAARAALVRGLPDAELAAIVLDALAVVLAAGVGADRREVEAAVAGAIQDGRLPHGPARPDLLLDRAVWTVVRAPSSRRTEGLLNPRGPVRLRAAR